METLTAERPDDAILSEEGKDDKARLTAARTWIVDPLDGTREFSEHPRIDWAVYIALVIDGQPVVGAVALPGEELTLSTETAPTLPAAEGQPRVIVSRTRRPPAAVRLADKLDAAYIEMGSAGAKAMAVVKGEADIYAHSGGQYEWDSCAPVAVALAAGLHCSRLDGSPMVYNNEDVYLPDLLICRQEWAERCLEILNSSDED
jgi:3'(2'), 5'-bisphosphate nucleotidase